MINDLLLTLYSAGTIAFLHTILGPDHYLPFVAMSRSGQWSLRKTSLVTILCGSGHVLSSVLLGITGVGFGVALNRITAFQSIRGNIAAWALIAFGLAYSVWGIRIAIKNRHHKHLHGHDHGIHHVHSHKHHNVHLHPHAEGGERYRSPWILFTIFLFGPSKPLIPLLMYPAAKESVDRLVAVIAIFAVVTIITMLTVVLVSCYGLSLAKFSRLSRYSHAMTGITIFLCGVSIQFFGL
jgi:sulfite exporter TauE/SafE